MTLNCFYQTFKAITRKRKKTEVLMSKMLLFCIEIKKKKKQCTLLVDKKNYALLIFFKRGICPSLWSSQQEVSNVIETNLCIYELKLKILRVSMN